MWLKPFVDFQDGNSWSNAAKKKKENERTKRRKKKEKLVDEKMHAKEGIKEGVGRLIVL